MGDPIYCVIPVCGSHRTAGQLIFVMLHFSLLIPSYLNEFWRCRNPLSYPGTCEAVSILFLYLRMLFFFFAGTRSKSSVQPVCLPVWCFFVLIFGWCQSYTAYTGTFPPSRGTTPILRPWYILMWWQTLRLPKQRLNLVWLWQFFVFVSLIVFCKSSSGGLIIGCHTPSAVDTLVHILKPGAHGGT